MPCPFLGRVYGLYAFELLYLVHQFGQIRPQNISNTGVHGQACRCPLLSMGELGRNLITPGAHFGGRCHTGQLVTRKQAANCPRAALVWGVAAGPLTLPRRHYWPASL